MTEVRLRLLGPVELHVDGVDVQLGPARQRTVLAALAVDAGRPVITRWAGGKAGTRSTSTRRAST